MFHDIWDGGHTQLMYHASAIDLPPLPVVTTRRQGIGSTVAVIICMGTLVCLLIFGLLSASANVPLNASDKAALAGAEQMVFIVLFLLPSAIAGAFWLTLGQLRVSTPWAAGAAALGFTCTLFTVTGLVMSLEAALFATLFHPGESFLASGLWWLGVFVAYPSLLALDLALIAISGLIGFACAWTFANWKAARSGTIAPRPYDFPLALVVTTGVTVISFTIFSIFLLNNESLLDLLAHLQATFGLWAYILILTILGAWLMVPAAIIVATSAEHTLRELEDLIPVPPETKVWLSYTQRPPRAAPLGLMPQVAQGVPPVM